MAVSNDTEFCYDCGTDEFIWYLHMANTYQCDKCWDDTIEPMVGFRQYT